MKITKRTSYNTGRITARPGKSNHASSSPTGLLPLGFDPQKDGWLYVPPTYSASQPVSVAVMLHGSGGNAEQGMSLLRHYADAYQLLLVAPASRKYTWDIITDDAFGPDVLFINQALELVFENYAVDSSHIALGGFSDGASYALCVGLTNGDLFTHLMAFSPGFSFTRERNGTPAVFLSHGVQDPVLPIDPCGRRIVPQLQKQGLAVEYLEFEGGHEIPAFVSQRAMDWFSPPQSNAS